ncbi:MAG: preprotein translocase subunit YajC [Elusimicrobia bacterium]|nr:preprotein translocase subunit YajC [Elusimicrobiota bacterium]
MNGAQPNPLAGFVPLIAMVAIFYFLVIRPQQKQQKAHEAMLAALKKGDRIVTSGGLYAVIVDLRGPDLDVKLGDSLKVRITRASVAKLANGPELASTAETADKA